MSKANTKKQPKAKIKPVVDIVGIKAIPKAEQIANKTHLITYNIIYSLHLVVLIYIDIMVIIYMVNNVAGIIYNRHIGYIII